VTRSAFLYAPIAAFLLPLATGGPTTRTRASRLAMNRTMKTAAFLTLVCLSSVVGRGAGYEDFQLRRLFRVKKDLVTAAAPAKSPVCVYADVSSVGKKAMVCGDPVPVTLSTPMEREVAAKSSAAATAAANDVTNAAAAEQQRQVEEKCFDKKKEQPVKLYLEQQQPVHYVQPQVTYVQPQVHYEQPEVHYQPIVYHKPQVHLQPVVYHKPEVHLQPIVYHKPEVHLQPIVYHKPVLVQHQVKPICNDYGDGYGYGYGGGYGGLYGGYGGYGGGYIRSAEEYPTLLRTVETDHFINDVPVMRSVETAALPYDGMTASNAFASNFRSSVIRPSPIPLPRSAADPYVLGGYGDYGADAVPDPVEFQEYGVQPEAVPEPVPYPAEGVVQQQSGGGGGERSSGPDDLAGPQYGYSVVQIDELPRSVAAVAAFRPILVRYDALPVAQKSGGQRYVELGSVGGAPNGGSAAADQAAKASPAEAQNAGGKQPASETKDVPTKIGGAEKVARN